MQMGSSFALLIHARHFHAAWLLQDSHNELLTNGGALAMRLMVLQLFCCTPCSRCLIVAKLSQKTFHQWRGTCNEAHGAMHQNNLAIFVLLINVHHFHAAWLLQDFLKCFSPMVGHSQWGFIVLQQNNLAMFILLCVAKLVPSVEL